MGNTRIAFQGTLQQLLDKVENGDMVPKLQASHAPPCKFWTAFQLMNLMPLIPSRAMRNHHPPTCEELRESRLACDIWVPQFRACVQCSADVIHMPHKVGSHFVD